MSIRYCVTGTNEKNYSIVGWPWIISLSPITMQMQLCIWSPSYLTCNKTIEHKTTHQYLRKRILAEETTAKCLPKIFNNVIDFPLLIEFTSVWLKEQIMNLKSAS